ncbi:MAG: TatD family hydrolase [Patescibacteria group bacterium]
MWTDTHAHPFAKAFSQDREEVIERAREAGVSRLIVVGFDHETNRQALKLAEDYDFMWATLGVHPCETGDLTDEEFKWIRTNAAHPRVVALGEMGLDYHHMSSPKDVQKECFRKQVRLAKELDLPCIVHSRDAAEDTLALLLEEGAKKVVFHCYSYDLDFARRVWAAGYYTSFSGVVTYPQAQAIQEAAAKGPIEQILVETDCPFLAPQSIRGKRNEMAYTVEVGEKVAELRGEKPEVIAAATTANAVRLFGV